MRAGRILDLQKDADRLKVEFWGLYWGELQTRERIVVGGEQLVDVRRIGQGWLFAMVVELQVGLKEGARAWVGLGSGRKKRG